MKRPLFATLLASFAICPAFSQPADAPPKFEAADIRESAKSQNNFPLMRMTPVQGGRFELKSATMVDLIHQAYNVDGDKVLGGPSWLEMNHYDVTAKIPAGTTPEAQKLMLQALLAERFKLVIHNETKPLPTHALVAGKKPQLKEAAGTEDPGCKPQTQSTGGPEGGGMKLMMAGAVAGGGGGNGAPVTFSLGPGGTILYGCRNMSMEAFAANLRSMMGTQLGPNAVVDETGLKGKWNFDVRWSLGIIGPAMGNAGDRISLSDALEKQLGLKLEDRQIPMPVMVVDSVNEKPSPNPPGTSDILPMKPPPTEFEVASVKPADPNARGFRMQMQPGGRVNFNLPMRMLLMQAFAVNNNDQLVGVPAWADSAPFDILAKAPSDDATSPALDRTAIAPMLRALLADRFKMTYHQEDRPVSAYTLMAGKPKLKKADPASRTYCKNAPAPQGAPPGTRVLNCQNVTMAQFAEHLEGMSPELQWPVTNSTGLEGTYDLNLTFTLSFNFAMGPRGGGGDAGMGGGPTAPADPTGGITVFAALEKEFGLKLEKEKRTAPVYVIDHLEQKPTEN